MEKLKIKFIIIAIIVVSCLVLYFTFSSSKDRKINNNKSISSDNTYSITNTTKITSLNAISYAKQSDYFQYTMKNKVKDDAYYHTLLRFTITDEQVKDNNSFYTVTIKGNASGYTDDYDTHLKLIKFEITMKVYPEGRVTGGTVWTAET